MKIFGGLFGEDGYRPLYEHHIKISEGARLLPSFLDEYLRGRYEAADKLANTMAKFEEEADAIKDETRRHISSSIFTAVRRADVIQYLSTQDDIADCYTTVVVILTLRRTLLPTILDVNLKELCGRCMKPVETLGKIVQEVAQNSHSELIDDLFVRLAQEEHKAADSRDAFLAMLFKSESSLDPVSVVILMRIAEEMVEMAKQARNSGDILRRLLG
ncbi:MAG: hypothetical protein Kow00107_05410 [Planctomycetota bacterium]